MQLREDEVQLTLVAFGSQGSRADELLADVAGLECLRPALENPAGWVRRDFGFKLDQRVRGGAGAVIAVTFVGYGLHDTPPDFVPSVNLADGVLFFSSGDPARDAPTRAVLDAALAQRLESPPSIVERVPPDQQTREGVAEHLRALMTSTIEALASGALVDYWAASARHEATRFRDALYGALRVERIMETSREDLLGLLMQIAYERASRACREKHVASHAEYYARLDPRWREVLAVNALEVQTTGAGLTSLFGDPGNRAVEPLEMASAIDLYVRIGGRGRDKADVLRDALAIAEREGLWDEHRNDFFETPGWHQLAALTRRFQAAGPVADAIATLVHASPERFTLPAYDEEWSGPQA